ncbi:hypothetical protein E2C01_072256 [Portunus trituberculatus]|uniref:Uncharacterized protein n=1 Tax=Portunus trituberculatus TaxID=210409 RepID=A0A5B7I7A4_PORTR|nr:hypothetical protein [Portunus trituberculatus]
MRILFVTPLVWQIDSFPATGHNCFCIRGLQGNCQREQSPPDVFRGSRILNSSCAAIRCSS